ncbi:MAG TPA: non-canonical purine NTP pyrophosphatase [Gemmatales bacterium]|nr:non-canonical purine NTP pyrophosphatase [Gemmatales bacterium]HMP57889.1 non-canonical purine NTP pyrophosphatase [Gemmatales bacterium]
MPRRLVIGSRNRKKIEELRPLLADLPLELVPVTAFSDVPEIAEDGTSFLENATKKAVGVAWAAREWTLAEDSGLVVPALSGAPGIHSAYYAGRHGADAENNAKLMAEVANLPAEKRDAHYVCVAVLADPEGTVVASSEGRCHGRLLTEPSGSSGFGYDPLFLVPEFHRTFGELSPLIKQVLSHRSRAIAGLRPALKQMLGAGA